MKVIGHRGAAGSELENTLASIKRAMDMGIYAIEIDVRKTKDGQLVVCHDADLLRTAGDSRRLSDLTLNQLQKIPLLTGSHVPTLSEALDLLGNKLCIIELKETGCGATLIQILKPHPKSNVIIASFKREALEEIKSLDSSLRVYALERTKPLAVWQLTKQLGLDGIGINYWILNPLTYWLCKRYKKDLYAYVVDSPFQAKFLSFFYPDIAICTNYPERFIKRRKRSQVSL